MKLPARLHKIVHWEYWPSYLFYIPILPYYFFKALQAKSFTFFLATNPAIKFSGHGSESKFAVMQLIPKELQPKTILIQAGEKISFIQTKLQKAAISYPLIAKPDIGFRGLLVEKIATEKQLQKYLQNKDIAILLQEFLDYKYECGIFYSCMPGEKKGQITSVTLKKFLTITGNGKDTVATLIKKHDRAYLYFSLFDKIHAKKMYTIPKKGERIKLSAIGNHSKGSQFINGNHLITNELEASFDRIKQEINGWYYGRFDIKYNDFKDVEQGKNFKIIELNGLLAEPTHIYDAEHQDAGYFTALKTIQKHWKLVNQIARKNHSLGIPYPSFKAYRLEAKWLKNYARKITLLASKN